MEKETKKEEEEKKGSFNFEEEIDKSKILREYLAKAQFSIEKGRYTSFFLKCLAKIDDSKKAHSRDEQLKERQQQFLIKYLAGNAKNGKVNYDGVFQVRQNNETQRIFYCWVITFEENYKLPLLVLKDEKQYLEGFYFKKEAK
jgi:hypothetical protein